MNQLHCLINPSEYRDVAECAQILISDILSAQVKVRIRLKRVVFITDCS